MQKNIEIKILLKTNYILCTLFIIIFLLLYWIFLWIDEIREKINQNFVIVFHDVSTSSILKVFNFFNFIISDPIRMFSKASIR